MKITERDVLTPDAVERLCAENDWYTNGTPEYYQNMLMCCDIRRNGPITAEDLLPIAQDILAHSDQDANSLSYIMEELSRGVHRWYVEVEE